MTISPRARAMIKAKTLAAAPVTKAKRPAPYKPQITFWSFSRYSLYRQCPRKAKLVFIDKHKEPSNEAMARGNDIHKMAEDFIKGTIIKLPAELKKFAAEFKKLRTLYKRKTSRMMVEDTWAFTRGWTETVWNDWVGCWVRIKLDCGHWESEDVLVITDWKTGKYKEDSHAEYLEQLELYALGALLMFPHLETVKPRLVYTDLGIVYPPAEEQLEYTRADLPRLKKEWEKRVKPMLTDTKFAPRPSYLCRYCIFSASHPSKTGLCKF